MLPTYLGSEVSVSQIKF